MVDQRGDIEAQIRRMGFDTVSAQQMAAEGRIEEWVHQYLLSGVGGSTNPQFSDGLKLARRWWNGPLEIALSDLSPAVGPQPDMEYVVDAQQWHRLTSRYAQSFSAATALPPLICEYRDGELSIRDGNTRFGAMQLLGWETCWVIIWYNNVDDYRRHAD